MPPSAQINYPTLFKAGIDNLPMAYKAKDAAMVNRAKEGEKVRFRLENLNGAYTITKLEKQP